MGGEVQRWLPTPLQPPPDHPKVDTGLGTKPQLALLIQETEIAAIFSYTA